MIVIGMLNDWNAKWLLFHIPSVYLTDHPSAYHLCGLHIICVSRYPQQKAKKTWIHSPTNSLHPTITNASFSNYIIFLIHMSPGVHVCICWVHEFSALPSIYKKMSLRENCVLIYTTYMYDCIGMSARWNRCWRCRSYARKLFHEFNLLNEQ